MQNPLVFRFLLLLLVTVLASCTNIMLEPPAVTAETVWIDVRTVEEYQADHIDGDRNMPLQELSSNTLRSQLSLPADADIRLYCVSGVRAGRAKLIFEEAGFTHVINAGGISDAREARNLD